MCIRDSPWAAVFNEIKENVDVLFTIALANLVFYEMMVFIGILILGIVYAWKKGVLQWK